MGDIQKIKLKGTGCYLPERVVTSLELDERFGQPGGTYEGISGVTSRRYANSQESSPFMGARAAMAALENAGLKMADIDLIIGACGTSHQAIPCTAALIQRELQWEHSAIPCFDVNSTCLSFLTAFHLATRLLERGDHRNVLIVSSEVASVGLNHDHLEAAALFGDGAAAVVLGAVSEEEKETSELLAFRMETHSKGADTCEILGGGSGLHPSKENWELISNDPRFLFKMDGPKIFRMASKLLPPFVQRLEQASGVALSDATLMIPHQASESALDIVRRKLKLPPERFLKIIQDRGNMIAASLPLGLHHAIQNRMIRRGDTVYFLGTSAGFSIGGMVLRY